MLRLVRVTRQEVDILFQLVCFNEPAHKQDLMAGLMQLSEYFNTTNDKSARLVLPVDLFNELRALVETPWMPADATAWGMPQDVYLDMVARMAPLKDSFSVPDMVDFHFLNVNLPVTQVGLPN